MVVRLPAQGIKKTSELLMFLLYGILSLPKGL